MPLERNFSERHSCLGQECRALLVACLKKIAEGKSESGKIALILSGGTDTAAILEASKEAGVQFDCAITVFVGDTAAATDKPYSTRLAQVNCAISHQHFGLWYYQPGL
jgi:hypothetical protein